MTPGELHELRSTMLALLSDPREEGFWDTLATGLGSSKSSSRSAADIRKVFLRGLVEARMRWVSSDAGSLAEMEAMADVAELSSPFPHGLLVFEEPLTAVRVTEADAVPGASLEMTGILWTDVLSPDKRHGVAAYALLGEVRMPSALVIYPYGHRVPPAKERQMIFVNVLPKLWGLGDGWVPPVAE